MCLVFSSFVALVQRRTFLLLHDAKIGAHVMRSGLRVGVTHL